MIQARITPFANDIFAFAAIKEGLIKTELDYSFTLSDLETLNSNSLASQGDLIKISFSTLGNILDDYVLLPVGSCLGYNNGPKIVASKNYSINDLPNLSMGVPGKNTTAYLLSKALLPKAKSELELPYNELIENLKNNTIDCALTIHETRFQLEEHGLVEVADIYDLWKDKTSAPLPLGGLVAKKSLGAETIKKMVDDIKRSLDYAYNNHEEILAIVQKHSFNKDLDFINKNIDLYVNDETKNLSELGIKSIDTLLKFAAKEKNNKDWLFIYSNKFGLHNIQQGHPESTP